MSTKNKLNSLYAEIYNSLFCDLALSTVAHESAYPPLALVNCHFEEVEVELDVHLDSLAIPISIEALYPESLSQTCQGILSVIEVL